MLLLKTKPGEQVLVIPDWAYRTLARKGRIEDLINFSKMRQWFTQEQLIAINHFSKAALSIFWNNGTLPKRGSHNEKYSTSVSYVWTFPEDSGQSKLTDEKDIYVQSQLLKLADNEEYGSKMTEQYILDYLKGAPANTIDLHQSYSVYSASDKLIVVALGQGVLAPVIFNRKEELRLSILGSIVGELQKYYDLNVVHKTKWFEWYFTELDVQK